jgi:hypothetical protein
MELPCGAALRRKERLAAVARGASVGRGEFTGNSIDGVQHVQIAAAVDAIDAVKKVRLRAAWKIRVRDDRKHVLDKRNVRHERGIVHDGRGGCGIALWVESPKAAQSELYVWRIVVMPCGQVWPEAASLKFSSGVYMSPWSSSLRESLPAHVTSISSLPGNSLANDPFNRIEYGVLKLG